MELQPRWLQLLVVYIYAFSYPSTEDAYLVIDGYTDMSEIKIDPAKRQISGWVNNQRFVNDSKSFRNYFVVQFDKPFEDYGVWENQKDEVFPQKLEWSR